MGRSAPGRDLRPLLPNDLGPETGMAPLKEVRMSAITVGLDGSPESLAAADWAAR